MYSMKINQLRYSFLHKVKCDYHNIERLHVYEKEIIVFSHSNIVA